MVMVVLCRIPRKTRQSDRRLQPAGPPASRRPEPSREVAEPTLALAAILGELSALAGPGGDVEPEPLTAP